MTDLPDRLRATGDPACVEYADVRSNNSPPLMTVNGSLADAMATALLDELELRDLALAIAQSAINKNVARAEQAEAELVTLRSLIQMERHQAEATIAELETRLNALRKLYTSRGEHVAELEALVATMWQGAVEREAEIERLRPFERYEVFTAADGEPGTRPINWPAEMKRLNAVISVLEDALEQSSGIIGAITHVRVHDHALTEDEIRARHEADLDQQAKEDRR